MGYEEKYNVVLVEWKKFCCREDYRKPLEYAFDIIKNHERCNCVADTRNGFENIPEDTEWVAEYFMPKATDSKELLEFKYICDLKESLL